MPGLNSQARARSLRVPLLHRSIRPLRDGWSVRSRECVRESGVRERTNVRRHVRMRRGISLSLLRPSSDPERR